MSMTKKELRSLIRRLDVAGELLESRTCGAQGNVISSFLLVLSGDEDEADPAALLALGDVGLLDYADGLEDKK